MVCKQGALYTILYTGWRVDYNPLIFVLYSDRQYTIGINVHYINMDEYKRLVKMFDEIHHSPALKKKFFEQQRDFYYDYLKPHFKDFIDIAFRKYHTSGVIGIPAHRILLNQIGKDYNKRLGQRKLNQIEFLNYRLKKDDKFKHFKKQYDRSYTMDTIKEFGRNILKSIGKSK